MFRTAGCSRRTIASVFRKGKTLKLVRLTYKSSEERAEIIAEKEEKNHYKTKSRKQQRQKQKLTA